MTNEEAKALLDKYNNGLASPSEAALLQYWFVHEASQREMAISEEELQQIVFSMGKEVVARTKPGVALWSRIAVAAAVATIAFGIWFYTARLTVNHDSRIAIQNDIAPGKNTATLTLGMGKVINLSDAKSGLVIGNDLRYNDGTAVAAQAPKSVILTAATPLGGTYQFTLPDGTKVWLNADSRLKFPSKFDGDKRNVKLEGEAYFEVAKDKSHPFLVQTDNQTLEVLGTHFNISSYSDENTTRTTLLEGSVKINDIVLRPGQEAVLTDGLIKIISADIEAEIAWKNGDFVFSGADFRSVMREIMRWYNVTVEYDDSVPDDIRLDGWVSRKNNLSVVLRRIESLGNVHFKLEGRRITVSK
jgi:transmembrane sensor